MPFLWPVSLWQRFALLVDDGRPGFTRGPWYTLSAVLRLTGPLRRTELAAAFAELVAGHDLLRTRVVEDGPLPGQLVSSRVSAELEPAEEPEVLRDGAVVPVAVPMDRPSPIRLRLVHCGPDEHLLAVHIHHLLADPATLWGTVRDLAARYSARLGGPPAAPPSAQYGEFTLAQAELARAGRAADERWWRAVTRDVRPRTLRPAAAAPGRFQRAELLGAAELTAALRWARRNRATPFVTLLAALAGAAAPAYAGTGPLLFFTLFSRRDQPRWQRMLGSCTLPLYLPVPAPPQPLTAEYVRAVRDVVLAGQRHIRFPAAEVEALAGIPGYGSRTGPHTVPFFEYLPIEWPAGLRFGPATATVLAATGPRDDGTLRSLGIRCRPDAGGALVGRTSWDGRDWPRQRALEVGKRLPEQLRTLVNGD